MKRGNSNMSHARRRKPAINLASSVLPGSAPSVPDHELIRPIGKGSYGEVWLAKSLTGTYRAVKIVRRGSFSDGRPFEREFRGLKRFEPISRTHPGFVSLLHIGSNEGSGYFYCIMELADDVSYGQTIHAEGYEPRTLERDLVRQGRLPAADCLEFGLCLASALKELHRHGLIHRDIKPSNIIFVNGTPKLADIGLVTEISEATTALGTRGFAPPENPGSPMADLYSLGKVLYQLSTGKSPEQFPELPTEINEVGEGRQYLRLNEIILKACEIDPGKRYQSAETMSVALAQCKRTVEPSDTVPNVRESDKKAHSGERKLLTVLLVNIIRTARADPEQVQGFMKACMDRIRPILQQFGGMPAQVVNEGVMAIFGATVACEDHAFRAIHAALAVRQKLGAQRQQLEAEWGFGFEIRFCLDTGLAILSRSNRNQLPTGDVVDLASRLLSFTEAGQIVITETIRKAVQDYFVICELGERQVQAQAAPLSIYEVSGTRERRTRLEAGLERGLTPFVGRSRELAQLRERLADARAGHGQIVSIAGEAGAGKSRLLLEFQQSLGTGDFCWLAGWSISFGNQMAYLPIIDLVRGFFRIKETDDSATVCARIESEARGLGEELRPALPFIRYLLSVAAKDEAVMDMDAQERRVRTFEALRNLVLKKAQSTPVIIAVEDLHWADRTSEEFLVSLADSLSMVPAMIVVTYRPEYHNCFPERSFVTRLTLQQLSHEESLEMASRVLTVTHLPDQLGKLVLEKAEGNPFFVEEMIKSLLEKGILRQNDHTYEVAKTFSWSDVPDTIQDVIMSRIDRLEESPREALQLASVIGREFQTNLLETIANLNEPLAESLRKLKSLELIYERSIFPEHTYYFKHALTQEVAYSSLLLERRKELHCLVAAAIEELYAARLPEYYGLLAYHYERGEEWERALDYLRRAAERSRGVGAHGEESFLLSQAMAIAQRLGQTLTVTELRGQRGTARVKVGMWAEARPDLETALKELPPEDLGQRSELLSSLAAACFWGLDVPGMQRSAAEGHALAQKAGRDDLVAGLLAWLGASRQASGDLTAATQLFKRALAKGAGYCSAALGNFPLTLYLRGRPAEALERARESADAFRSLSDAFAATFSHAHLGLTLAACGQYKEATRVFNEARQLGKQHEVWQFHARAIAMSAGFHLEVFDFKGNERLAEEARERARSAGFQPSVVSASLDLVFNFTRRAEIGTAEKLIEETAAASAKLGGWHQWLWQVRLAQARAEIACARGDWTGALERATTAVSGSRARGRKKYQVMGLETRARVLTALGRKREAIKNLQRAVQLSRLMGDPALFLRAATAMLAIEGDDLLLQETRDTARRILAELPDAEMRAQFLAAESVRLLGSLTELPRRNQERQIIQDSSSIGRVPF
jgi:class 3 adenylate cyclase/tetratricopeptide (TPR) repeat protein